MTKQEVCPRNNNHKNILDLKTVITELKNSVLFHKNLDHAEELKCGAEYQAHLNTFNSFWHFGLSSPGCLGSIEFQDSVFPCNTVAGRGTPSRARNWTLV